MAKDLNNFLDKYDKNNNTGDSFASKSHTPSKFKEEREHKKAVTQIFPSNSKRSLSRNNTNKSLIDDEHAMTNSFYIPKSAIEGNELFADVKLLTSERTERQSN